MHNVDTKVNSCIEEVKWIESNYSQVYTSSILYVDSLLDYLNSEKEKVQTKVDSLILLNKKIEELSNIIDLSYAESPIWEVFFSIFNMSIKVLEQDYKFVSQEFVSRDFSLELLTKYSDEIDTLKESIEDLNGLVKDFKEPDEELIKLF